MKSPWNITARVVVLSLVIGGLSGVLATALTSDYLADYAIELEEVASRTFSQERPRAFPKTAEEALDQVRERALPGVVEVYAPTREEVPQYFSERAIGRGVLMSSDGWMLVVSKEIGVPRAIVAGREVFTETDVARDAELGVSFIKVDAANLPVLAFGSGWELVPGDQVFVLPSRGSLAPAHVTRVDWGQEQVRSSDIPARRVFLSESFDAGSVVTDLSGALVGIVGSDGTMIPIDALITTLSSLLREGEVVRASLGVQSVDLAHTPGVSEELTDGHRAGALLYGFRAVPFGSAAQIGGLARGDIIVGVNGELVNGRRTLDEYVAQHSPDDVVVLRVIRGGEEIDVSVTLGRL